MTEHVISPFNPGSDRIWKDLSLAARHRTFMLRMATVKNKITPTQAGRVGLLIIIQPFLFNDVYCEWRVAGSTAGPQTLKVMHDLRSPTNVLCSSLAYNFIRLKAGLFAKTNNV